MPTTTYRQKQRKTSLQQSAALLSPFFKRSRPHKIFKSSVVAPTLCACVSKHGSGDQRSLRPLTLAPASAPRRPRRGGGSAGRGWRQGGALSSSVAGPVPNRLRGQSEAREQSVLSGLVLKRPGWLKGTGQDGSDCPQCSAAFQMSSIPLFHSRAPASTSTTTSERRKTSEPSKIVIK